MQGDTTMNMKSECCKISATSITTGNSKTGNGFVYLKELTGLAEAF
jgi:hypothetical protein